MFPNYNLLTENLNYDSDGTRLITGTAAKLPFWLKIEGEREKGGWYKHLYT
jgi:hypothetical protein